MAGIFIISLIVELDLRGTPIPTDLRIGLTIDFLGDHATYSIFGYETSNLDESSWPSVTPWASVAGFTRVENVAAKAR